MCDPASSGQPTEVGDEQCVVALKEGVRWTVVVGSERWSQRAATPTWQDETRSHARQIRTHLSFCAMHGRVSEAVTQPRAVLYNACKAVSPPSSFFTEQITSVEAIVYAQKHTMAVRQFRLLPCMHTFSFRPVQSLLPRT